MSLVFLLRTSRKCFLFRELLYPGAEVKYSARLGEHNLLENEATQEDIEIKQIVTYPGRIRKIISLHVSNNCRYSYFAFLCISFQL